MNTETNAWESSESKMQLSIYTFHLQKTCPFHEFYQKLTEQSIRLPPTLCNYVRLDVAIVVLTRPHKTTGRFQCLCNHVIDQSVLIPDTSSLDIFLIFPAITTAHKLNVSKTTVLGKHDGNVLLLSNWWHLAFKTASSVHLQS